MDRGNLSSLLFAGLPAFERVAKGLPRRFNPLVLDIFRQVGRHPAGVIEEDVRRYFEDISELLDKKVRRRPSSIVLHCIQIWGIDRPSVFAP